MNNTNEYLTVREFRDRLAMNGVDWGEIWIRMQISTGKIKSSKMFNSRVIPASEVSKILNRRNRTA